MKNVNHWRGRSAALHPYTRQIVLILELLIVVCFFKLVLAHKIFIDRHSLLHLQTCISQTLKDETILNQTHALQGGLEELFRNNTGMKTVGKFRQPNVDR
jgi:hypothetical protein